MLCAMHCGTQHSEMVGKVHVMSEMDYERWLKNGGKADMDIPTTVEEAGHRLYTQKNCINCHVDHDTIKAPTLYNIYGTTREMSDGSKVKVDDDYLRDSIVNPWRVITKGYGLTMPSYAELTEEQVLDLVRYMKTLTGKPGSSTMPSERETRSTSMGVGSQGNATTDANSMTSAGEAQFKKQEHNR